MPNDRDGALQQSYRLFAGSSVRLERKTGRVTEVKDSGDAFVKRSIQRKEIAIS